MMSRTQEALNLAAHSCDPFNQSSLSTPEDLVFDLFRLPHREDASIGKLISVLKSFGLREDDPRLRQTMDRIREIDSVMSTAGSMVSQEHGGSV